jgi:cytochrome c biogenesis protein CcmG/thiol:disulfide interchange protein DsbE
MNWRRAFWVALVTLPLIALLAFGFGRDPHRVPFALAGKPAPDFTLRTLEDKELGLTSLRGKPVVLNFWSTWCEPCKLEHELLQQAARFYGEAVQFVGVVYQDSNENARAYLEQHGSAFPQLADPDSRVAIDFGVAGVPESFLLDASGVVMEKQAGVLNGQLLRDWLDPRVGGGAK